MHINKTQPITRLNGIKPDASSMPAPVQNDAPAAQRPGDAVQLSAVGLALSSAAGGANAVTSGMDATRISALRDKVMSGAYNSLAMADKVARSIISSGDL